MEKIRKNIKFYLFTAGILLCMVLTGCGKEKDPQTTEVIKLSITPEATPTPTPKVIQSSAVTTNGELTMVNEFRVSEDTAAGASDAAALPAGSESDIPEGADDTVGDTETDSGDDFSAEDSEE
ncbi:MAG: hypothetical protein IJW67_00600 [Blautia sp.]|nr:hypothetical protein [Blautia sp.]